MTYGTLLRVCPFASHLRCPEAWWDGPTGSIAVMSSGGMSAQLTFPSDSGLVASSIPHNQKEANDRIRDPKVSRHLRPELRLLVSKQSNICCPVHSPRAEWRRSVWSGVFQTSRRAFNRCLRWIQRWRKRKQRLPRGRSSSVSKCWRRYGTDHAGALRSPVLPREQGSGMHWFLLQRQSARGLR